MAKKLPTEADRLASDCPFCGAYAGKPCTDYRGKPKELCRERGRPDLLAKKLARKAGDLNRRAEASYGPLFAHLMPESERVTPADLLARRRREAAFGAESASLTSQANEGLQRILVWHVRRAAARLLGADREAALWEYCERVYGWSKESYMLGHYRLALCTADRLELRHEFREDPGKDRVVEWPNSTYPDRTVRLSVRGGGLHCTLALEPEGRPVMAAGEWAALTRLDHRHGVGADAPEADTSVEVFDLAMSRLAEGCRVAAGV